MKFLVDENIEPAVVDFLRSEGHDVMLIGQVSPGVADRDVLHRANLESRILLTNDKDFGEIVYRDNWSRLELSFCVSTWKTAWARSNGFVHSFPLSNNTHRGNSR